MLMRPEVYEAEAEAEAKATRSRPRPRPKWINIKCAY